MAGGLDDILNNAVPGGLSKPLMIALGTLLIGKMMGGAFAGASAPGGATQQGEPVAASSRHNPVRRRRRKAALTPDRCWAGLAACSTSSAAPDMTTRSIHGSALDRTSRLSRTSLAQ